MEPNYIKIQEIIKFLQENDHILNSHITEAYTSNMFSLFPEDWFDSLEFFSYQDYLRILKLVDNVKKYTDWVPVFKNVLGKS